MRQFFAIIKWGIWQRRWFFLWWSIAIAALIAINLAFYPSFRDQAAQLNESLANIPDSAKALTTDTGEFASPVGFLSSQVYYLMLPMLLGIMSISLGSSLLAREEKDTTIELLLSRPISRGGLLFGKAIVGILLSAFAAIIGGGVTVVMAKLVDLPINGNYIIMTTLSCYVLALSFGAIAFLFTSLGKARIASIGIATLVALGGYIVASLASLASWLESLSKAFPFYYYRPGEMLYGHYLWRNLLILGSITIVSGIISWIIFRKRDISS